MVFLERPLNFHGFWTPRVYIYMSFLVMWLIGKVKKGLFQHLSLSTFHNWWLMISEGFVRRLSQLCWETETFRGFFFGFGIELRKKRTLLFFLHLRDAKVQRWKLLETRGTLRHSCWSFLLGFLDLLPRCCGSAEIQEMLPKEIAQKPKLKISKKIGNQNHEMQEFCLQSWVCFVN